MILGFEADEILSHLLDSPDEKGIDLLGNAGIVHTLGHHHSDGEIRQDIE